MAEKKGGGGFGWFLFGGIVGLVAGAYIASGPGRDHVDSIRSKTIELTGGEPIQKAKDVAQKARDMVTDSEHPVGRAIQDGIAAAKRRRSELEDAVMKAQASSKTNGPAG